MREDEVEVFTSEELHWKPRGREQEHRPAVELHSCRPSCNEVVFFPIKTFDIRKYIFEDLYRVIFGGTGIYHSVYLHNHASNYARRRDHGPSR